MEFSSEKKEFLGTLIEVKIPKKSSKIFSLIFDEFKRIEGKYSRFNDNSYLSKMNLNLKRWQKADEETIYLIKKAEEIKKLTDGNFDITLLDTLERLGYDKEYTLKEKKPNLFAGLLQSKEPIKIMDDDIYLKKKIEFGGIGKGYAIDRASEIIESNGVKDYYINAGGDIFARHKDENKKWVILLEHPDFTDRAIGKVEINNMAIASSSSNRRRWGKNHHLINAKTRKPISEIKSIFVIAKNALLADSYATALFTSGFGKGIELSKKLDIDTLIISEKNKMYKSENFKVEYFN